MGKRTFPTATNASDPRTIGVCYLPGMSLRDYFAAAALSGFLHYQQAFDNSKMAAHWAYEQADAMLKERATISEAQSDA